MIFFLGSLLIAAADALFQITHGLILLVPLAAAGTYLGYRLWRTNQRRQSAAEAAQRAASAEQQRRAAAVVFASHMGQLMTLTPTQFEHAVHDVLRAHGYQLTHRGRSGDRGVDLEGLDPAGMPVLVQCKQYALHRTVGGPEIRGFLGALAQHDVPTGLFVTTASFTSEAHAAVHSKTVALVDGPQLVAMAQTAACAQSRTQVPRRG